MTPEIRLEAIKIAHTLHQDVDSILASADKLVHFIVGGDTPAGSTKSSKPKTTEQTQPASQPSAASTATPSAAQTAAAQEPAASTSKPSTATIVYDDVKKLILKLTGLGTHGRNAALKVLGDHGVAKGPDLKPEQFESAHKALTDALAAQPQA